MDCIAAISTPIAKGGVAMIRISGEDAFKVAEKVFIPRYPHTDIGKMEGYTAAYGDIVAEGENGSVKIDDGIITVFKAPHSYTGENVAEITCHGGIYMSKRVLRCCLEAGANLAAAGEFTKQALINGKMSLTEAESVIDIINAGSEQQILCARAQKNGALYRRIESICEDILKTTTEIAVWIDYPDESEDEDEISKADWKNAVKDIHAELSELLSTYESGEVMKNGITAAIVGKPNAGKSTLMNLLSGTQKSIVTDIEGTTRDIVENEIMLEDIPLHLLDCAGIRETDDMVERIGVEKMRTALDNSQLILAVFDGSRALSEEDYELIRLLDKKSVIPIINKSDLELTADTEYIAQALSEPVILSAKQGDGIAKLSDRVREHCNIKHLDPAAGFIANARQRKLADDALSHTAMALSALTDGMSADAAGLELEAALTALYELSGKSASEEVINSIFERFCVGK